MIPLDAPYATLTSTPLATFERDGILAIKLSTRSDNILSNQKDGDIQPA